MHNREVKYLYSPADAVQPGLRISSAVARDRDFRSSSYPVSWSYTASGGLTTRALTPTVPKHAIGQTPCFPRSLLFMYHISWIYGYCRPARDIPALHNWRMMLVGCPACFENISDGLMGPSHKTIKIIPPLCNADIPSPRSVLLLGKRVIPT